jgi:prepilin-type N-terminal cleavage/methylation domain-containing protein
MRSTELTKAERQLFRTRAVRVRRARRGHVRGRSPKAGFTIIELIVAIVILVVGVLGLAGTAGMVSRMVGGAAHQTIAANVAASRFERLRSVPCPLSGGTATTRNIDEKWSVSVDGGNASLYLVTDTVTYRAAGGPTRTLAFGSYVICR